MHPSFQQIEGIHWETGTLYNVLNHLKVINPITDQPFTEAMLLGISGGVAVMYFVFEFTDPALPPQIVLGTRYPFDALDRVCKRLNIHQQVYESSSAAQANQILREVLDQGEVAIVWADRNSLPYNALHPTDFPVMLPITVFWHDGSQFAVADRAHMPLLIGADHLSAARARQATSKHRLITLSAPDSLTETDLIAAVRAGIRDCCQLYTEPPSQGDQANFGLAALRQWADDLTTTRDQAGWVYRFPPGGLFFRALTTIYDQIQLQGTGGAASRRQYAAFLEDAHQLLALSTLKSAAGLFRISADLWEELAALLLADSSNVFREVRQLLDRRHQLFIEHGDQARGEMQMITAQIAATEDEMNNYFPMSDQKAADLRGSLREKILQIYDVEEDAVEAMQRTLDQ